MMGAMRVLIVGCGYVGLELGATLVRLGHRVFGVRRSETGRDVMDATGICPVIADTTRPGDLARLPGPFGWVVFCAAPDGNEVEDYRRTYLEGARCLVDALAANPPRKLVFTSSTSVYGQDDGSRVDETSPAEPATETGRILRESENVVLDAVGKGIPSVVLRVAGIYGPGRDRTFRQLLSGQAVIENDGSRHVNMIHRDDVVTAIVAALKRGCPGEIYNVVDDAPTRQSEFLGWLAGTLGTPMPARVDPASSMKQRRVTNKRVNNNKARTELGWQPAFPTFREGYAAQIAAALKP